MIIKEQENKKLQQLNTQFTAIPYGEVFKLLNHKWAKNYYMKLTNNTMLDLTDYIEYSLNELEIYKTHSCLRYTSFLEVTKVMV